MPTTSASATATAPASIRWTSCGSWARSGPGRLAMTGKERILAAMRKEPVDRVPVMCQLAIGHYLLNTDVTPAELWFTSEGFARALVTLQQRYRFDGILINLL